LILNTKKTAIYPNYQLDESHQTKNTLSESKSTTPRTSSRTLIVDQNTNLGIELFENKKRIKIRCNLQAYRREKSRINIGLFISKSSELLSKSTPNRGYLGPKSDSFRCKFCTDYAGVSLFSTPNIVVEGVELLMWPENRGPLRSPGNPVTNEFEASSVDLFFFFFVLFLVVFVKEFASLIELVELISVVATASGSSDQSY